LDHSPSSIHETLSALSSEEQGSILHLRPQKAQEPFLASNADICIFGGAAGVGKTYALLLDAVRHVDDPSFAGVYFRRETTQIRNPGGMWTTSQEIYPFYGATPRESVLEYEFPAGGVVKFAHLEHENSVLAWDGSQIPVIGFDQLEHFLKSQFFYMLSRNRDPSGHIRPYIRATCNPDPDSWLAEFLEWWIEQEERLPNGELNPGYGYPIPERAGAVRWMLRDGDDTLWADSREELLREFGNPDLPEDHHDQPDPLSVCFIPGTIYDNEILLRKDPGYLRKLKALDRVSRARLLGDPVLGGNWKVRPSAGLLFQREWCPQLQAAPTNLEAIVRGWDLAATEEKRAGKERKVAWTVGVKLGRYRRAARTDPARWVVLDVRATRETPSKVEDLFIHTVRADGRRVRTSLPQDPGQAGKGQVQRFVSLAAGYDVKFSPESGDKVTRFNPFSAQAEAGNVDIVVGPWTDAYIAALEAFPDAGKDFADATSRAFDQLLRYAGVVDVGGGAGVSASERGESATAGADSPWG
jgi:predicted phage terminase large subunit-like protein